MEAPTPFPIDDLGAPTITVPPEDADLEQLKTGLDWTAKALGFLSIATIEVPGLPEVCGFLGAALGFIGTILGAKIADDIAKAEISVIENATARVKESETSIEKQTQELQDTLVIIDKARNRAKQNEKALIALKDALNKAFTHSLQHFDTISMQLNHVLDSVEDLKYEVVKSLDAAVVLIKDEDKRLSTQRLVSRLNTVCNFFFAESKLIVTLPLEQKLVKLEQTPGIFDFIKHAIFGTDGTGILTKLLDNIFDENLAIPDSIDDKLGFAVLKMLCFGVNMYAVMLLFQMQQHEILAQSYYDEGDLAKFNKYHLRIGTEFKEFSPGLIEDNSGAIAKVLKVLDQVMGRFDTESEQLKSYANSTEGYVNLRSHLWSIRNKFTEQIAPPKLDGGLYFDFSHIETPINEWKTGSNVLYAMQLYGSDAASSTIVGDWSTGWTLDNLASPVVMVGTDMVNRTRVIFRKIDEGKPQIAAYLSNATMYLFNDVNRDLFDSAYEPNKELALENVKRYLEVKDINVNVLLDHSRRAIHGAAETNNWEVASELIKKGAFLDVQTDEGNTPLYIASMKGYYDFVRNLVEHGANVTLKTTKANNGFTALHIATIKGHANIVKLLVNTTSVDVNAPSVQGFTPLHYAATFNGEEATAVLLADHRVASNATSTELKLTPLHIAAIHNSDKVAKQLIDIRKVDIEAKAFEGHTALHFAAVHGSSDVLQLLLDKGASLTDTLSDNSTPLHLAAFNGDVETVQKLLNKTDDKDVDPTDNKDLTPLYLAYKNDNLRAVNEFKYKHASATKENADSQTFLHLAAKYGHLIAVKNLLHEDISVVNEDSTHMTALNYAVNNNFIEIVNELLKGGANPNCISHGKPLVHFLVDLNEEDALSILKVLVIYNVNIDAIDTIEHSENSFFQVICEKGYLNIAIYLYEQKVNIYTKNKAGKTALDLAREKDQYKVVDFLESISTQDSSDSKTRTRRDVSEVEQFDQQELNLVRQRREAVDSSEKQVTSAAAGRPSSLINHAIECFVSAIKSLPAQLSNLVSLTGHNCNEGNSAHTSTFASLQSTDLNSTLLLLDVLIRKNTGQRYVNLTMAHSDTPLESRLNALVLVEQLQVVLRRLAHQSGQKVVELDWFGLFRKVEQLVFSAQYDKIESLLHSSARNAFAHGKIDKELLFQMVDKLLIDMSTNGQKTSEPSYMVAIHSISGDTSPTVHQRPLAEIVGVHKVNLI